MSIRPENLTLDKLLQGRLFRIPDYQRTYSWQRQQRTDLFEDINKLSKHPDLERHHFMSTIVCLKTGQKEEIDADEFSVFSVVDGQQRLTTLIILLKSLSKKLLHGDPSEKKAANKLEELLVKESGRLILLQTNHDNKSLFRNYLENGSIPDKAKSETSADKNMIDAFEECEKFIENNWQDSLIDLLKLIKNRLDFIFYVLEDEGSVHNTFEVLNSRGLDVDWLDKCKNVLMGIAFEKYEQEARNDLNQELRECWSKIYQTIGLNKVSGEEILKFAATLEGDNTKSSIITPVKSIDFFRNKCNQNSKLILKYSELFLVIAKQLKEIKTNQRIEVINKIIQVRLLVITIKMNSQLSDKQKKSLLQTLENVSFRIFGLFRKDSRTKVGDYVVIARSIFELKNHQNNCQKIDNNEFQKLQEKINKIGNDYPADKAAEQLREQDCYKNWRDGLRYFLRRYEEHLCQNQGSKITEDTWEKIWNSSPSDTIEHICPQSFENQPSWNKKLGTKKDYIQKQVQRLGNLVLLPPDINSKTSNKSFTEKKLVYEQNRQLKMLDEIIEQDDWNTDTLTKREQKLIEWAKSEWA